MLELLKHDLVVWLGGTIHAGWANPKRPTPAPTSTKPRLHGHMDSPALAHTRDKTDRCKSRGGTEIGFVASIDYCERADLVPTARVHAAELLLTRGVVVLPCAGAPLLDPDAEEAIVRFASESVEAITDVQRQAGKEGWRPIENGYSSPMVKDTRRQVWRSDSWADAFETAAECVLREVGLLACAPDGPFGGQDKWVCDAHALRSLPGCPQQPAHADVQRDAMRYRL